MDKGIPSGNDLGELPSIDNSSSSESGLDKLSKTFNENKLQIIAFLSFSLFIIFSMSLVVSSVDLSVDKSDKSDEKYKGNKSLDKLYEEADGNKALSNARMTSKIDLSTDKNSCSFYVEYKGNNDRKVSCTSCLEEEDESDKNDQFCRQFVYGDDGGFEYSLLDDTYVAERRATKDSDKRIKDSTELPTCLFPFMEDNNVNIVNNEEVKNYACALDMNNSDDIKECNSTEITQINDYKDKNCGVQSDVINNEEIEEYIKDKSVNRNLVITIIFFSIILLYLLRTIILHIISGGKRTFMSFLKGIYNNFILVLLIINGALVLYISWREYKNKSDIKKQYDDGVSIKDITHDTDVQVLLTISIITFFITFLTLIYLIVWLLRTTKEQAVKHKGPIIFCAIFGPVGGWLVGYLLYKSKRDELEKSAEEEDPERQKLLNNNLASLMGWRALYEY